MKRNRRRKIIECAWAVIWPKHHSQGDGTRVVLGTVRHTRKLAIELMTRAHGKTWRQMQACGFRCQRLTISYADPRETVTEYLEAHLHGLPITPAMERSWRRFEKQRDAKRRPLDDGIGA